MKKKWLKIVVLGMGASIGLVTIIVWYTLFWPIDFFAKSDTVIITIEMGTPTNKIVKELYKHKIISSERLFKWTLGILGKSSDLKAGRFALPRPGANYKVIRILSEGKQLFTKVTIPEGLNSRAIAGVLKREMKIDSLKYLALLQNPELIDSLKIPARHLEGYLLPETYYFTYGMTERQILYHQVRHLKKAVWDTLEAKARTLDLSIHQAVTLASIIEAEAILDSEMVYISSVYHNRLRLGIPLQADPTIQFIIPDGPRRLLKRDLQIDSPYNTYIYSGLPPGPINNPGKIAILAALNPKPSHYLYFVADGTGGHIFSETLRQHLNAKRKFDAIRREVARAKREKSSGEK